jgi:GNAT superfamily N-acetyltransferase
VAQLTAELGYDVAVPELRARLSRLLARSDNQFFVAEIDDHVVAWLHATIAESIETGPFVMIAGLVVASSRRGQGIGRMLMDQAEAWAKEQHCSLVRLWSTSARTGAHRFYQHLGYTIVKTQYSFARSLDPAAQDDLKQFVPRIVDEGR